MQERLITVFGGTGFLGRRVVRAVAQAGFRPRIAARHPDAVPFSGLHPEPSRAEVDIRDDEAVTGALEGAMAAVNAVSLYVEKAGLDFDTIHVDGAGRIARLCREAGIRRLVHISGIGSDPRSPSKLIRAKARGEEAVSEALPDATIFRPSVMFGRGDAFVQNIDKATRAPIVPLFGRGRMRLQPAWVRDVADGVVRAIKMDGVPGDTDAWGGIYELGGARVLTYREAVEAVCAELGRRRLLIPFPFAGWKLLTQAMGVLPNPPLTIDQLYLLAQDNTVSEGQPGFEQLGIEPQALTDMLSYCLSPRMEETSEEAAAE